MFFQLIKLVDVTYPIENTYHSTNNKISEYQPNKILQRYKTKTRNGREKIQKAILNVGGTYFGRSNLQIVSQAIQLVQHEVNVVLSDCSRRDDAAEEVGPPVVRLIADHQRAGLHHPGF